MRITIAGIFCIDFTAACFRLFTAAGLASKRFRMLAVYRRVVTLGEFGASGSRSFNFRFASDTLLIMFLRFSIVSPRCFAVFASGIAAFGSCNNVGDGVHHGA